RIGHVQGYEACIRVRDEEQPAVGRRSHPVPEAPGEAALTYAGVEAQRGPGAPIGDLTRMAGVGDVEDPSVALAAQGTHAAGRVGIGARAVRHAAVHEGPAEVVPVAALELVHPACAASDVQTAHLRRMGGVADVPEHEATEDAGVVARSTRLDAGDGDVMALQGSKAGAIHDHVLGRGLCGILEHGHHCGSRRIARVDHRDSAVGGAELWVVPVLEAPAAYIREASVDEYVGVEAAPSQIVLAYCDHVPGGAGLDAFAERLLRLVNEVLLVGQELRVPCSRGRAGSRDGRCQDGRRLHAPLSTTSHTPHPLTPPPSA